MAESEKAKLYNEIIRRTSDKVMLERMRLLGFWPAGEGLPPIPADEAAERATIDAEIAELRRVQGKVKDPDKALAEERKRRWAESKKRRAERKIQKEKDRQERREEWDAFRQTTTVHAGDGVSAGLDHLESKYDGQFKVVFNAIRQLMAPRPSHRKGSGHSLQTSTGLRSRAQIEMNDHGRTARIVSLILSLHPPGLPLWQAPLPQQVRRE